MQTKEITEALIEADIDGNNLEAVVLPCPTLDCVFQDEKDMQSGLRELLETSRAWYKERYGDGLNYAERFTRKRGMTLMIMYTKPCAENYTDNNRFTDNACAGSVKLKN